MTESSDIPGSDRPAPPMRRWAKWSAIGLGTAVLLVLLALSAFTLVMSRVPAYRTQLQTWLSERAKLDVQFDAVSAAWRLYGPELVFTQLVVRSPDRQRVLGRAAAGGVGFDLWQAIRNGRLAAARLALQGTEIKIQRRKDGQWEVVGQADWPEFDTDTSFKLDSLPVGKLMIRDVRLSVRDLKTARGPWVLDHVAVEITRGARDFDISAQAALPGSLGKSLSLTAHGEGKLDQVDALRWRAQIAGTEVDLGGWTQIMPADWIAPRRGLGSFQLAAEFVGATPQRFTGRIDFVDVLMNLPHWKTPLPQADALQVRDDDADAAPATQPSEAPTSAIASTATPLDWRYSHIGLVFNGVVRQREWRIQFDRLELAREDSAWSPGTAQLRIKLAESVAGGFVSQLQARIDLIVLDNLWPLLAYLPESEASARLRALNASGRFMNVAVNYERQQPRAAPRYGVRAQFVQLGVSPVGKTPGFNGLSGVFSATGARGELWLDSHDLAVNMPRIFRTPLPVDQVSGHFNWQRSQLGVQLSSRDLVVTNSDGQVHARLVLDLPRSGAPNIDLQAEGANLLAAAAPRYLPAGIMRKRTLAWLDAAFPAGVVQHMQATLQGPLDKFPFRGGEGLFLIKAQIHGLTMNYQDGWLPATDLNVDAEFRNAGLTAVASAGRVNGLNLEQAQGRIKDFRDAEIFVTAKTHGELGNALSFVQQSPVGPVIGTLFQRLSGSGDLRGDTDMYLPLKDFAKRRVDIKVALRNASVNLADAVQGIERLNGTLRVLNDAVVGAELRGQFLQDDFTASTEPAGRGRYNIVAIGQVKTAPLVQFLKLPAWVKLEGATRYRYSMPGYAQRDEQGARRLYSIDSDLRGIGINLPMPVLKEAGSARPLHIDADMRGNDLLLRGALGDLRALVRLQPADDAWRFERAGLRADGVAAALPGQPGLRIDGRLETFTLDEWLKLGNANGDTGSAVGVRVQDILRAASVNIGRLRVYGFEWPEVRGILQATDAGWRVDVAGDKASGQVLVPYEFSSGRALTLNMETLWLNGIVAADGKPRSDTTLDPRDLPALRADIKHFRYGEHDFGALQLSGTRTAQGLQVGALQISGESFRGTGTGSWLKTAGGQQNSLALSIESSDVRATMQQFNYADFIAAKRGKLSANLSWPDGLDENLLGRSSGTLEVQVDDGQLLNVQPGAGRVLGLFSIAALPRRLSLDFHDVTDKGLAFDRIHADFTVQNGDARTQNLLLRGPTAEIGIAGRMGLGARDYDQTAVVTGDVSSALPVAGVVAAGPVVGAALLLFSQIFKETLKGVARAYYHIGGSWDDPQVERIDAEVGKASLSGAEGKTP